MWDATRDAESDGEKAYPPKRGMWRDESENGDGDEDFCCYIDGG